VSTLNSSLALEEMTESQSDMESLLQVRHLSISNALPEQEHACHVVKVSGSVTVSF